MLPLEHPDRIQIAFGDYRLVNNAGLLLRTLAQHVGLRELVGRHLDLGDAPGRANAGDKMLTLVDSALAGGDCIDDADALRAGRTSSVLGCMVKAHSGDVPASGQPAGPGEPGSTWTYGLAKEGARHQYLIWGLHWQARHHNFPAAPTPLGAPGCWG